MTTMGRVCGSSGWRDSCRGVTGWQSRPWQDGQLTAGLQHGVLHLPQIGDALPPQSLQQLIHRQAVAAHGILQDVAAADDERRLPAQKRAEADAAETSIAEEHGQRQQRDDGDDAVNQRDAEILHGDGGQIAEKHGQHQLDGLQFLRSDACR